MERLGTRVSEKVIRRLMKEMRLTVKQPRRARYSSYKGEITPAADNLTDRDFKAPRPNEKWLTDITEFGLSDGKVYLSPMIDCFDGMPVTWTIGTSPDADLVNTMLDQAIAVLPAGRETDCSFRPRLSLPLAGVDPENAGCRAQAFHVKERMFSGQLCLRGIFRAFKKRAVLPQFFMVLNILSLCFTHTFFSYGNAQINRITITP